MPEKTRQQVIKEIVDLALRTGSAVVPDDLPADWNEDLKVALLEAGFRIEHQ